MTTKQLKAAAVATHTEGPTGPHFGTDTAMPSRYANRLTVAGFIGWSAGYRACVQAGNLDGAMPPQDGYGPQ